MQNDNIKIKCLTDNNYNCLVIFETDNKMNAVVELKLLQVTIQKSNTVEIKKYKLCLKSQYITVFVI